jgi:hypothetical protein
VKEGPAVVFLTDLANAARKSGLRVVELPGWKARGRPASTGGFDPMGVLCHHTAGASNSRDYVEWMAYTGRPSEGLPAPLCQLALDRQGTVYVCAAGRSNHAGTSGGSGPIPRGDGNALLVGIEAMNTGSEGWTATQYDAYVRLAAALCLHYGWPASHVRAHKETSVTGKVDPSGATPHGPAFDMDRFRADVARLLRDGIGRDWLDMPTNKDIQAVADAVADKVIDRLLDPKGAGERFRQFLLNADLSPNNKSGKDTVRNELREGK